VPTQAPSTGTATQQTQKSQKKAKKEKPKAADSSQAGGVASQVPQGPPAHAAEQHGGPPGQQKNDSDEAGREDKDKDEKEKGPKK
jgi:hypothetical protein